MDHIEFKAGRMNFDEETKKVTPDKTLGKIRVFHVEYKI